MKFICDVTKEFNIKTIVSLNPIMIDGTGMCGGCRVTIRGFIQQQVDVIMIDSVDVNGVKPVVDEATAAGVQVLAIGSPHRRERQLQRHLPRLHRLHLCREGFG